jgi:hypothetical protein
MEVKSLKRRMVCKYVTSVITKERVGKMAPENLAEAAF